MSTSRDESLESPHRRWHSVVLVGLLVVHAGLLAWIAAYASPTLDEVAHLPAGISHWKFGRFELYRVNPPLVRSIAAFPTLFADPVLDWSAYHEGPYARPEFGIGTAFVNANGTESFRYFTWGRWALIPVSLMGLWVCCRWSTELFGPVAGLVAGTLWCFSPNVLGNGAMITPDLPAASFGVLSAWTFHRWLRGSTWGSAILAGVTLGLAELTKTTWIVLFPLWTLLWLIGRPRATPLRASAPQFGALLVIAVYLLNLGYGFEGSFRPLGRFDFVSRALGGEAAHERPGNRFSGTILGHVPVPLPANYVRGIDVQKYDFERGKWSYLRGEQKLGGWWYYYVYGLAVKVPLGTLALLGLALVLAILRPRYRASWRSELCVLMPAIVVVALVSSQTGFNRYLRYVVPALPFLFVAAARVGRAGDLGDRRTAVGAGLCVLATVVGSLSVFPHSLSYFNLAAGGPGHGWRHLVDANIDWGQDLLRLKRWCDAHPEARPLHVAYFGMYGADVAGIDAEPVPSNEEIASRGGRPSPGWYAVSVNHLAGYHHYGEHDTGHTWFQTRQPVDRIGYSIYVYHVEDPDDVPSSRDER